MRRAALHAAAYLAATSLIAVVLAVAPRGAVPGALTTALLVVWCAMAAALAVLATRSWVLVRWALPRRPVAIIGASGVTFPAIRHTAAWGS